MQNTVPKGKGAMAAVIGAETELIEKCLAPIEDVSIANYNCPGQIVITGKKSAVEQAVEALKAAGVRRCVMLNVSGPFHSPMMIPAGEALDDGEHQPQISLDQFPAGLLVPGLGTAQEFHGLLVFQHLQLCRVDARDLHLALHGCAPSNPETS